MACSEMRLRFIGEHKIKYIKCLVNNGMNVNRPIRKTEKFAGFIVLHDACLENYRKAVQLLFPIYEAYVNDTAVNGNKPILFACFSEKCGEIPNKQDIIGTLAHAKPNVDIESDPEIWSKHFTNKKWYTDFGNKSPLVAYLILNDKMKKTWLFEECDVNILTLTNKTLLTYLAEEGNIYTIDRFMLHVKDPILRYKLINHRDDDDVPLTHYPFHPKKYGNFRYHRYTLFTNDGFHFLKVLLESGADIYALINNDPATFLPNLAAYRGTLDIRKNFLPYYTSMSLSRVLHYATLPIDEDSDNLIRAVPKIDQRHYLAEIEENREICIEVALKDLVFRRSFKLPVPQEEIKLMDQLIASDQKISDIVNNYNRKITELYSMNIIIEFGDRKIKMTDFLTLAHDDKKLRLLAQEDSLLDAFCESFSSYKRSDDFTDFYDYCYSPIIRRIKYATNRLKHLENLKKISSLREAIPLPYELVLEIVEYLNNLYLDSFIRAFYSYYPVENIQYKLI